MVSWKLRNSIFTIDVRKSKNLLGNKCTSRKVQNIHSRLIQKIGIVIVRMTQKTNSFLILLCPIVALFALSLSTSITQTCEIIFTMILFEAFLFQYQSSKLQNWCKFYKVHRHEP